MLVAKKNGQHVSAGPQTAAVRVSGIAAGLSWQAYGCVSTFPMSREWVSKNFTSAMSNPGRPHHARSPLANGSAFNIVENVAGTLGSLMDNGTYGTLLEFTGFVTVTNGQQFTVTHDDGLTLIIGGNDLGFNPGPTAPSTSTETYTGPSGNFAFQLVYAECCGGPAVLQVDLPFSNIPAPEPATLALLGLSLGLGFSRRKAV